MSLKSTLTLRINVKLRVTRVFYILNSNVMDWEKAFNLQNCALNKTLYYYHLYVRYM